MFVHGLRLLVALVTFVVGVAASWLLGSGEPASHETRVGIDKQIVIVGTRDVPLPPAALYGPTHCTERFKWESGEAAEVEGGILNDKARSLPAPVYPVEARAAYVNGTVPVRVVVRESGRVTSAEAVGGPKLLRRAAEDAAREALFAPTVLSGRPVRVAGIITYNFSLK